ncbi:hypothetical protein Pcinc_030759 [Petrolisthes cinctipes]|uniref:Uncharacterized protein n=1 Tax=Petrolisthes cinctipes TaxID=88211 RepID=A0AAE1EXG7_PETCI|nr:hypothetical protein Pcinc_030759 [Petrolisthes cinctipes]
MVMMEEAEGVEVKLEMVMMEEAEGVEVKLEMVMMEEAEGVECSNFVYTPSLSVVLPSPAQPPFHTPRQCQQRNSREQRERQQETNK